MVNQSRSAPHLRRCSNVRPRLHDTSLQLDELGHSTIRRPWIEVTLHSETETECCDRHRQIPPARKRARRCEWLARSWCFTDLCVSQCFCAPMMSSQIPNPSPSHLRDQPLGSLSHHLRREGTLKGLNRPISVGKGYIRPTIPTALN